MNLQVKGQTFEGESFGGLYIRDTVFSDCGSSDADVTRSSFIACIRTMRPIQQHLSDSYFDDVRISDSKLVGTNLGSGTAKRLSVTNSNMSYTNWTGSKLLNLTAQDCDFQRAVFSECTLKSTTQKHDGSSESIFSRLRSKEWTCPRARSRICWFPTIIRNCGGRSSTPSRPRTSHGARLIVT